MAGHSKWANIKFKKAAQDKKRGKAFTKLIREITTAARVGGGDPSCNPRLRLAIDKAKGQSMPKDNIDRAVKRGSGDMDGANFEEARYEGYGPGGVAVMVDCLTDNRNRTVAEVRHAFSKFGGNLGADGSVGYLFEHAGVFSYEPGTDEDSVMEVAIEAGATDVVVNDDDSLDVLCTPDRFESLRDSLQKHHLVPAHAEVTMRAGTRAEIDADTAESLLKMLDMLDDLDDVQEVYSNADIPDEALQESG
jgi:YebC/PmpR family DNA-binding regulatory protein